MEESRFETRELIIFTTGLSLAKTPRQLGIVQDLYGRNLSGVDAVVSLPVYEPGYTSGLITLPQSLFENYVVPYFPHPYIYFIRGGVLAPLKLAADYTATFDTNFASYVKQVVRTGSFGGQQEKVKRAIHEILINNVNFDLSFYFVENIKVAYPVALRMKRRGCSSPLLFWKALNKEFRWNIVCLKIFSSVDCIHYQKTQKLKFAIGFREAVRESIDFTYKFYMSDEGQELINGVFLNLQRSILLQLLAVLRIEHSSRRGARSKLEQFLAFVHEKGGFYLERETRMAYEYFKDRSAVPMLEKINKGGRQKDLLKKIDNLAWDMFGPRYMERMFTVQVRGDYMIPFFFSFDENLRAMMRSLLAKAVVIDRSSANVLTVLESNTSEYFEKEGCRDILESFYSPEKRSERSLRGRAEARKQLSLIRSEYKALRMAIKG